ncbi:MAG: hypothetical protein WAW52_10020 [Methanothrix sp.]
MGKVAGYILARLGIPVIGIFDRDLNGRSVAPKCCLIVRFFWLSLDTTIYWADKLGSRYSKEKDGSASVPAIYWRMQKKLAGNLLVETEQIKSY